jgi:hypothetical protein
MRVTLLDSISVVGPLVILRLSVFQYSGRRVRVVVIAITFYRKRL